MCADYFFQGNTPGGSKFTERNTNCLTVYTLLWSAVNNKTIMQETELNRCTTAETRSNRNEEDRTSHPRPVETRLPNSLLLLLLLLLLLVINPNIFSIVTTGLISK